MGEVRIDDMFAQFEAEAIGTFRPAPLDDVTARVRSRRRTHHVALAVVIALLIAAPAGVFALTGGHPHVRPPQPAVSPVPSVGFDPQRRPVRLAGVDLPLQGIWMTKDAAHAWAFFNSCIDREFTYVGCRYALGRTSDGGQTWQRVALPDIAAVHAPINLYALDGNTLAVHAVGKRFWLTTDSGATFTTYPDKSPPAAALHASTYPVPGGDYLLLCPGEIGFEDGASGLDCQRKQLVKIGSGPVHPQPTVAGQLLEVVEGSDGRIWLDSSNGDQAGVAVSTDGAKTWHEVPDVPAGVGLLTASPDGRDTWLASSDGQLWRLSESGVQIESGLPANNFAIALNDGVIAVVTDDGNAGFWRDGVFTPIPGLSAAGVDVLADGTVSFYQDGGRRVIGIGPGLQRQWVELS